MCGKVEELWRKSFAEMCGKNYLWRTVDTVQSSAKLKFASDYRCVASFRSKGDSELTRCRKSMPNFYDMVLTEGGGALGGLGDYKWMAKNDSDFGCLLLLDNVHVIWENILRSWTRAASCPSTPLLRRSLGSADSASQCLC